MGNVTHYAKAWLNISPEIRAYLEEGRLQRRIRWLQQVGQCGGDQAWLGCTALEVGKGRPAPRHFMASSCEAPGCPPSSCEDQAGSLCRVDAVPSVSPEGMLGPVCVHGEDRGLRGMVHLSFSLLCLPLCPSSLLTSTNTQRS